MRCPRLLPIAALMLCTAGQLVSSPSSDLSSPSRETRDAAAKVLRDTYIPPARERWESVVAAMEIGISRAEVLERLKSFNHTTEMGSSSGNVTCEAYRLDQLWMLRCSYHDSDHLLFSKELLERPEAVWVEPPPHLSGVWVTYYSNGQPAYKISYKDGRRFGDFISFRPDGSKCVVQPQGPEGIADGEEIGFFPSGRVMHRGRYKAGKTVGTWTWYNEDGSVQSTKIYPSGS